MKQLNFMVISAMCLLLGVSSCETPQDSESSQDYQYTISLAPVVQQNAPALQSFAHAVSGSKWLLFAGRTNKINDDGGLHDVNGPNSNYSTTSFVPRSFNESIYVYDVSNDSRIEMSYADMLVRIGEHAAKSGKTSQLVALVEKLVDYATVFRGTNPLVTQDDTFLYALGGYGTSLTEKSNPNGYRTFNHVARIHIASMIKLVEGDLNAVDWELLFSAGRNDKLVSTGGELHKIGETLYMAGGHNFGEGAANGQKYVDAVYPFTIEASGLDLNISVGAVITDVPADFVTKSEADNVSTFRRRDGPIVPALFKDGSELSSGLTFYGGVFKPDSTVVIKKDGVPLKNKQGKDSTISYLLAWNDAIYVHPSINAITPDTAASKYYTLDKAYYQDNLNVYSCADFELYDSKSKSVYTFLIGGIGDGAYQTYETLSKFTNTALKVSYSIASGKSTKEKISKNIFKAANYYGAESAFMFMDKSIPFVKSKQGLSEVVSADNLSFVNDSFEIGYVYGGIEAFDPAAGTFGPSKSAASNKIWKVTLARKAE